MDKKARKMFKEWVMDMACGATLDIKTHKRIGKKFDTYLDQRINSVKEETLKKERQRITDELQKLFHIPKP